MIQLPVLRHIKRFITSVILFGFSIVLMLFLPIQFISFISSSFFPYNVSNSSETVASELSIELLWLHVVLPALLEQSHMRVWIKNIVKIWAICVSKLLGLRSFLLGDEEIPEQEQQNLDIINQQPFQFNIGIAHQALLQNNGPISNKPFIKPSYFKLRVILC
jgi:E3 ubiquitin-protein ligase MARCH6